MRRLLSLAAIILLTAVYADAVTVSVAKGLKVIGADDLTATLEEGLLRLESSETATLVVSRNVSLKSIVARCPLTVSGSGCLRVAPEKGTAIKCFGDLRADTCRIELTLTADHSKGVRASGSVTFTGSTLTATATGHLSFNGDDPSYSTIVKADGDITVSGSTFTLSHSGRGGRGLSAGGNLMFVDSRLEARFDCDGIEYRDQRKDLHYYTSRVLDAKRRMAIVSGFIDIFQSGSGGKGISCRGDMTIGTSAGSDALTVRVETTGEAIVNDTIFDIRRGCPKAIKSRGNLHVLSGAITAVTHGVGGEGLECARYMKVSGGNIVCRTFDDGINTGKNLKINGGMLYIYSSDNDAIDSNGHLEINGGTIVAISTHERDEDFDCDPDFRFAINGGTVLGIAADYSRPTQVGQPYVQHTPQLWAPDHLSKVTLASFDIADGAYVAIVPAEGNTLIATRVPASIPMAYITATYPGLVDGAEVGVAVSPTPPTDAETTLDGLIYLGGTLRDDAKVTTLKATTEILDVYTH